jgi:hypothetical protein
MPSLRFPLALILALAPFTGSAATYYVATNGSDSANGSFATPWRTIQKAATVMMPGDTTFVRGGVYRETVVPARSGTPTARITYAAYSNEVVTIVGTEPVTNWTAHAGSIYVANLASNWFNSAMPGGGSRLWDPTVANEANFILYDGVMMALARWPNSAPGATNLLDLTLPPKSLLTGFVSKTTNASLWTVGVFDDAALPPQPDNAYAGAEIVMQPNSNAMSFVFSGYIAASTNAPGGGTRLTLYSPSDYGRRSEGGFYATNYALGSRYWLWNKMEFLDAPGEWFHDKVAGKLYFWPPDGANPEGRVEARKRRFAFDLSNRSYITVRGFKLVGCTITTDNNSGGDNIGYNHTGGVIQLPVTKRYPWRPAGFYAPSTNCILEELDINYPTWFTDVSGHFFGQWGQSSGVIVSGSDHILRNSTIRNSAGAGVILMGRRNRVLHCVVENVTCIPSDTAGIKVGHAAPSEDHEIARNTIRNTGRCGIQLHDRLRCTVPHDPTNDWRARVHHNDISRFCMQDWDGGGLYQGGWAGWVRIDHNWFHSAMVDVDNRPGFGSYTVGGVYLDFSQDAIVHHNVIWDAEWGIHLQDVLSTSPPDGNFLCYNNTILVRRNNSSVNYGPFGFVENSSAPHAGTIISNNLIACSQSLPNYRAIDDFPASGKGNNIGTNGMAGALSALGLNLQGGSVYPDALFPTAASAKIIDQGVWMQTMTRNGTNLPPRNDPVFGAAPDIGAYEFGGVVWRAGAGSSDYVGAPTLSVTPSTNGGPISISWPVSFTGWRLETQTNSLSGGLGTNWATVPGSALTNRITLHPGPAAAGFFRLVAP